MSDQPDDPHNLQNRIPGLRQLVFQLIQLLNSSGYNLETVVIASPTEPSRPTSIVYNPIPTQQTTRMAMAAVTHPLPIQPPPQPLLPPQFPPPSLPSPRPKRASTSLLDSPSQQTPPKRKRYSDPRPFWGTVLEQPSQPTPPPPPPPQHFQPLTPPPYIPPLHPQSPDRLHRTATLPTRLQPRTPPLPPITSQLPPPSTTPEIQPNRSERRFLRAAGHLLGRLSPFRTQPEQPQPSRLPERFPPLPRLRYPDPASAEGSVASHPPSHRLLSPIDRARRGRRPVPPPEQDQFFECEQCDSKFKRKSDKNRHVRVVHEKSRPFTCPLCAKTFGEKSNMLKHRASVHDDVRTFRCPYCELSFSQRGLCDTHVRTVHDKKQAKYFCEYCGLPFSRKVQLHEHYESDHPEYMASYAGQSSGVQALPPTRTAPQPLRDRGGPAPRDPFPQPSRPAQARPSAPRRGEAGPSNAPLLWAQYQQTTIQQVQPQTSNGMHQLPEQPPRPKGYNDESSGNGT